MKQKKEVPIKLPPLTQKDAANNNHIPSTRRFVNRLSEQNDSPLNQTYTIDTTRKMRQEEFTIDDAVTGFKPRARSSLSFKLSRCRSKEPSSRTDQSLFSASCKLPRLGQGNNSDSRSCTFKPWSRAQADLSQYKEALK